jgi:hypothetical protein
LCVKYQCVPLFLFSFQYTVSLFFPPCRPTPRDGCPYCPCHRLSVALRFSVFSLSAPPSLVIFTSTLDDTLTLAAQALLHQYYRASHGSMMVLLVGADDLFMTWHACRNLPGCRTSLAFVFHSVCSESIFFKTMIH